MVKTSQTRHPWISPPSASYHLRHRTMLTNTVDFNMNMQHVECNTEKYINQRENVSPAGDH